MFVFESSVLTKNEMREIMRAVKKINNKRKKERKDEISYRYTNNKTARKISSL